MNVRAVNFPLDKRGIYTSTLCVYIAKIYVSLDQDPVKNVSPHLQTQHRIITMPSHVLRQPLNIHTIVRIWI